MKIVSLAVKLILKSKFYMRIKKMKISEEAV